MRHSTERSARSGVQIRGSEEGSDVPVNAGNSSMGGPGVWLCIMEKIVDLLAEESGRRS